MLKETIEKAKELLGFRQQSYQQVFRGIPAERVLADLAKFCRAHETTFHPDPRIHAALEGRREVWLRIQHHLQMDTQSLYNLYLKKDI